jgi:hypothetical protein
MLCQITRWHAQIPFIFLKKEAIRKHSPNIQLSIKAFNDGAEQYLYKVDEAADERNSIKCHKKMSSD